MVLSTHQKWQRLKHWQSMDIDSLYTHFANGLLAPIPPEELYLQGVALLARPLPEPQRTKTLYLLGRCPQGQESIPWLIALKAPAKNTLALIRHFNLASQYTHLLESLYNTPQHTEALLTFAPLRLPELIPHLIQALHRQPSQDIYTALSDYTDHPEVRHLLLQRLKIHDTHALAALPLTPSLASYCRLVLQSLAPPTWQNACFEKLCSRLTPDFEQMALEILRMGSQSPWFEPLLLAIGRLKAQSLYPQLLAMKSDLTISPAAYKSLIKTLKTLERSSLHVTNASPQ